MTDDDLEEAVEGFVDLEAELTSATGGTYEAGTVSGGSKVAAGEVPDGYPVTIDTDHALRLDVQTDDGATLETYLPWPEPGSEADAVSRLLDALGLEADEFANVYGERVALEAVEGWHRVDVAGTSEDGGDGWGGSTDTLAGEDAAATFEADESTAFGVARETPESVGLRWFAPATAVALGLGGWLLLPLPRLGLLGVLAAMLSLVAIPATLVYDAYETDEEDGWDPNPILWGLGGLVPLFHIGVGVAYLVERLARSQRRPSGTSFWGVSGATAVGALTLPLFTTLGPQGSLTVQGVAFLLAFLNGMVLMPLSIYFDAGHVAESSDWDPIAPLWAAVAFLLSIFFLEWVVGLAYLLWRFLKLD